MTQTFKIEGMACAHCKATVEKALGALDGVTSVAVNLSDGTAVVEGDVPFCVEVCPGRVVPSRLADYAQRYDEEAFLANHGMECCECGCCSFICPAKRPLTQQIKSMRKILLAKKKK